MLGSLTHEGKSFYRWTEGSRTRENGIRLLKALLIEIGDHLVVFFNPAGFFYATDVREFVIHPIELGTVDDTSNPCAKGDELELR